MLSVVCEHGEAREKDRRGREIVCVLRKYGMVRERREKESVCVV